VGEGRQEPGRRGGVVLERAGLRHAKVRPEDLGQVRQRHVAAGDREHGVVDVAWNRDGRRRPPARPAGRRMVYRGMHAAASRHHSPAGTTRRGSGGSLGGRAPRRIAPATGTWSRAVPAITQRSRSPPRLMSPRPTNAIGNLSRGPNTPNNTSTYLDEAMLPRRITSSSAARPAATTFASARRGRRKRTPPSAMSTRAKPCNTSSVTGVSGDRRPAVGGITRTWSGREANARA